MQHQQPATSNNHRRQTPGRRRQSRNTAQSPATHKQYASENDVSDLPVDAAFQRNIHGAAAGPQTPRKFRPPSPSATPNSQNKSRSSNKQRSKNAPTSPGHMKTDRTTPPPTVAAKVTSATTAAAFAGATFHASPAPSSLPIPSFMAKSVPDSPGMPPSNGMFSQEPSPPPTDSERPTPVHRASAANPAREESPLDFFFRADRAEKDRARRASSANALGDLPIGPFSPPTQPLSPRTNGPGPSLRRDSPLQQHRRPQFQMNSAPANPSVDFEGLGPAFSTPYQERIRAARAAEKPTRSSPQFGQQQHQQRQYQHQQSPQHHQQSPQQHNQHHQYAVDRSEALKNFLFAGQKPASHMPAVPMAAPSLAATSPSNASSAQAQFHQLYAKPPSSDSKDHRSADIMAIEDNLRRILKLDSPLSMGAKPPTVANVHRS